MKYQLTELVDAFDAHDAELSLLSWQEDTLICSAKHLNIHKAYAPDAPDTDMTISEAQVTFRGFRVQDLTYTGGRLFDASGNLVREEPAVSLAGKEARARLGELFSLPLTVMYLEQAQGVYLMDVLASSALYTIRFTCTDLVVSWDEYAGKAWYVRE